MLHIVPFDTGLIALPGMFALVYWLLGAFQGTSSRATMRRAMALRATRRS